MKSFPMFFRTTGRRIVIIGGGETAAQKARLATKTALTFLATGCPGADAALHPVAKAFGAVVNVVDQPELCDVITPSIVDRDPVVVAIGTEGTAPVLGRAIKSKIETMLPPRVGALSALAGRLRASVAQHVEKHERRAFWAWVFKGTPYLHHVSGAEDQAAIAIKAAIAAGGAPKADQSARLSILRALPDAPDLMTLRAVERLQEADVIFCDEGAADASLELARRDAERVVVSLSHKWPRPNVIRSIAVEVAKNKRAVLIGDFDPVALGRDFEAVAQDAFVLEVVPSPQADAPLSQTDHTPLAKAL